MSNLNKKIYAKIEAWRNTPIEGTHPYVYLDGIVMKRSWAGEVRNVSLLVAIRVTADGYRDILGICEGHKEDKAGLKKAGDVQIRLRQMKLGQVADWVGETVEETLSYYRFPDEHWRRIRTNNPLERIMREIRRRTRVVGAFPDGQSCLNLAAARPSTIAGRSA